MDYLLDVHTHTIASGHAYNTIMEMAKAGFDKGSKITWNYRTCTNDAGYLPRNVFS